MARYTLSFAVLLLVASVARPQGMMAPSQGTPRISHIMPMGGQAGGEVELHITGQDLDDAQSLHFNFPGVKVESLGSDTATVDIKGKGKAKAQPKQYAVQKFKVKLPANAPLGVQDVRIVTKAGISNPRAFVISDHKEFVEEEPNNDVDKAQRIELNSSVSGAISTPTDVDFFAFTGKKGQRVILSCASTSIDSRLPTFLQLYSSDGAYLGGNRNYSHNDALVDAILPADGEYFARVASFSYTQGGVDYFYRLTVTTAPWIDAVFPPVIEPGKSAKVTVYGRNLPGGKPDPTAVVNDRILEKAEITVKASADPRAIQRLAFSGHLTPISAMLDGFEVRVKNSVGHSNPFLMTYSTGPVVIDGDDNEEQAKAQKVPTPCTVAGRIEKKGDRDWFAFDAKKGQVFTIEALADRLGAPMDLYFQVRNAKGTLLSEQDDTAEILSPQFYTANTDPVSYRFTAPADDTFYVMVSSRDSFTQFGPRHIYTLTIAPEDHDFHLIAMPTSTLAPEGTIVNSAGGAAYNVYVMRSGSFHEDIHLEGEKLPPGISVKPQIIAAGQKQAVLVVHAAADAKPWDGALTIVGTATVNGKKLVREVRGASMIWPVPQANLPSLTRLDRELTLSVREKAKYSFAITQEKISVKLGDKIAIPVKLIGSDGFKTSVQVSAIGGPSGLVPQTVTLTPGQGGTVTLDAKGNAKIIPGNYTIFVRGQTQPINPKQPPPKGKLPPNIVQVSLPVTVTIVPKTLGKLTAPNNAKVQIGKEVEVTLKFARAYDSPLDLKVEAVVPGNAKGISVKPAIIKSGMDEVKIVISAAPNATISNQSITLRATAMFNGTVPIEHETKLNLSVTK
jgi:hypothetical protein